MIFSHFLFPQIEHLIEKIGSVFSKDIFKHEGKIDPTLVPEMIINGELVYGQKLVHLIEKYLDKYLEPLIPDPEKRKNITMAEFKEKLGINLIFTGSDLNDKELRILSAKATPQLPVKYACRISAGFPFFFPPIYW